MTSIELYVSRRLADLSIETKEEEDFYIERGYLRQENVTDVRKRAHELKMLCEHGIGDEDLIELSKAVYSAIVTLDERPLQKA